MIEVPHEVLNALFMLLIVLAGFNRSRQRSASNGTLARQSVGFQG
jgi:hypothetical protein